MATDEWNEQLRCPNCHKTGMVSLSQGQNDEIPTVHAISDGFNIVATQYGPDFHCTGCDITVDP